MSLGERAARSSSRPLGPCRRCGEGEGSLGIVISAHDWKRQHANPSPPMKVLLVTMYFPPAGGGGVQRPLKFATHLPSFGIETHVLAPDDPKWVHRDDEATPPTQAWVHRVRYHGPRGRIPSEELYAPDGIAEQIRGYEPRAAITVIPNGADYDDFEGLTYQPADRFRITHTGSFFGKRNPRPFLTALKESELENVVARFVGELTTRDREWAETLELGDRLELLPFGSRRRSLAYQRDSEALLLLLPQAGERGTPVLPGKIFEYLAAERPILAAVPPAGAAANLIREANAGVVVPPDDTGAIREGLLGLEARWRAGQLNGSALRPELRDRISRRRRVEELSELLLQTA